MPFGLRNAPSTFQRALDVILSGVRWNICLVYLEDVIIFSRNVADHLEYLDTVLTLLEDAGIKLKMKSASSSRRKSSTLAIAFVPGRLASTKTRRRSVQSVMPSSLRLRRR